MNYYLLEDRVLTKISTEKWLLYQEDNVLSYTWAWITIFHLDYDRIKPIVKSILEGEPEPEGNLKLYWGCQTTL